VKKQGYGLKTLSSYNTNMYLKLSIDDIDIGDFERHELEIPNCNSHLSTGRKYIRQQTSRKLYQTAPGSPKF
jgi:hypothetical protein